MIIHNATHISLEKIKKELKEKKYFCIISKTFSGKKIMTIRRKGIKAFLFENNPNEYELKFVVPGFWKIGSALLLIPFVFITLQNKIFLMGILAVIFFSVFLFLYEPLFIKQKKKLKLLIEQIIIGNIFDIEQI